MRKRVSKLHGRNCVYKDQHKAITKARKTYFDIFHLLDAYTVLSIHEVVGSGIQDSDNPSLLASLLPNRWHFKVGIEIACDEEFVVGFIFDPKHGSHIGDYFYDFCEKTPMLDGPDNAACLVGVFIVPQVKVVVVRKLKKCRKVFLRNR
jgi:hypothetical protein